MKSELTKEDVYYLLNYDDYDYDSELVENTYKKVINFLSDYYKVKFDVVDIFPDDNNYPVARVTQYWDNRIKYNIKKEWYKVDVDILQLIRKQKLEKIRSNINDKR